MGKSQQDEGRGWHESIHIPGDGCCMHLPCPALPYPALPCPALPCPALPCPALPCPALPCPALPCPALPCPALPALPCPFGVMLTGASRECHPVTCILTRTSADCFATRQQLSHEHAHIVDHKQCLQTCGPPICCTCRLLHTQYARKRKEKKRLRHLCSGIVYGGHV